MNMNLSIKARIALKVLTNSITEEMKEHIESNQGFGPNSYLINTKTGHGVVIMDGSSNNEERKIFTAKLREVSNDLEADVLISASESFHLTMKENESVEEVIAKYGQLGNHPDADEIATICITSKSFQYLFVATITRDGDVTTLGEWEEQPITESRYSDVIQFVHE